MKEFDLEKALKGYKIQTRDGHKCRLLCSDLKNGSFPLVVAVQESNGKELVWIYAKEGIDPCFKGNDLVMADDFNYYGLFLSEGTKRDLQEYLQNSEYKSRIPIHLLSDKNSLLLDHCTLLHYNQLIGFEEYQGYLEEHVGQLFPIEITGIGFSEYAIAFRCRLSNSKLYSVNAIAHITICTMPGGLPVDSNNITEWHAFQPFRIFGALGRE